jgi:hypothetical protein
MSTLSEQACSSWGCGLSGAGNIALGFGRPAVGFKFAPLTSPYGLNMMLPSWGWW